MGITEDIAGATSAHEAVARTIAPLTDADVRQPSLLPGWSVGHVITHLARNADSLVGIFLAANSGQVSAQYPKGPNQRIDDIEAGAGRSSAELIDDCLTACSHIERMWATTTDAIWESGQGLYAGEARPIADVPFRRWREVEIHHADLGFEFTHEQWSDGYVDREFVRQLDGLPTRLLNGLSLELIDADTDERWIVPEDADDPVEVFASRRDLLAWMFGRIEGSEYPIIGPWT